MAVTQNDEGHFVATGGNATGEVAFEVEGLGRADQAQVAAMQRGLRAAIPILLDCRRKAARRTSPAGETRMVFAISRQGRATIRVQGSTVEHPRGARCLSRFLRRHRFEPEAAGRNRVTVTFTGDEAMPVRPEGEEAEPAQN